MRDHELLKYVSDRMAHGEAITVTLDYSCLDKEPQPDMDPIWNWGRKGLLDLKGTEAMVNEFDKACPEIREKLREQYLELGKLRPWSDACSSVLGCIVLGQAVPGVGATSITREGKGVHHYVSEFKKLMFPTGFRFGKEENDFQDVVHISMHYLFARDVFLTKNPKDFPEDRLQQRFENLAIYTPTEFADLLARALSSTGRQG